MELIDGNRELSKAMGQLWGYVAMTIIDSDILPWNLSDLAVELHRYVFEIKELNCNVWNVSLLTDSITNVSSKLHYVANYLQTLNLQTMSNQDIIK